MQQFVVPQFIDVEDKIFGPISVRQFVILIGGLIIGGVMYKLFNFFTFLVLAVVDFGLTGTIAFLKINGLPFHFFILNLIQTTRRPKLKVWNKQLDEELLLAKQKKSKETIQLVAKKPSLSPSRLSQLALIVDTGGVYQAEEEITGVENGPANRK